MTNRLPEEERLIEQGQGTLTIDLQWDPKKLLLKTTVHGAPNYSVALAAIERGIKEFREEHEEKTGTRVEVETIVARMFSQSFDERPKEWDDEETAEG